MELFCFASKNLTNIWAGIGARMWAVAETSPSSESSYCNVRMASLEKIINIKRERGNEYYWNNCICSQRNFDRGLGNYSYVSFDSDVQCNADSQAK
jgi:hypothetical protein